MKIHKTKMKCLNSLLKQCTASPSEADKTSETPSLEANCSAGSILTEANGATAPEPRRRIKFPQSNQTTEWADLDDKLCQQLKDRVAGSIQEKISIFGDTIYDYCKTKYGLVAYILKNKSCKSR